jgi:hypothetical protein
MGIGSRDVGKSRTLRIRVKEREIRRRKGVHRSSISVVI